MQAVPALAPVTYVGHELSVARPGVLRRRQVPVQEPGPGEALIRTQVSLISPGTELCQLNGRFSWARQYPRSIGYSNVGVVESVGGEVDGLAVGDMVYSQMPHVSLGIRAVHRDILLRVPESATWEEAAFTTLTAIALYGVRKARVGYGETVLVVGDGLVGLLAAKLFGMQRASVTMVAGHHPNRLTLAGLASAQAVVDSPDCPFSEAVRELTDGEGADAVLETTGRASVVVPALQSCRPGGRLVLLGSYTEPLLLDVQQLLAFPEVEVVGAHQPHNPFESQVRDRQQILRWMADGTLDVQDLITNRAPYTEAARMYELLERDKDNTLGVVLQWNGTK